MGRVLPLQVLQRLDVRQIARAEELQRQGYPLPLLFGLAVDHRPKDQTSHRFGGREAYRRWGVRTCPGEKINKRIAAAKGGSILINKEAVRKFEFSSAIGYSPFNLIPWNHLALIHLKRLGVDKEMYKKIRSYNFESFSRIKLQYLRVKSLFQ